jgi:hypothetical protein
MYYRLYETVIRYSKGITKDIIVIAERSLLYAVVFEDFEIFPAKCRL